MEQKLTDNQKIWNDILVKESCLDVKKEAEFKNALDSLNKLTKGIIEHGREDYPILPTVPITVPVLPNNAIGKTILVGVDSRNRIKVTNPDEIYIILGDVLLKFNPGSILYVYDFETYWVFRNGDTLIQIDSCILNPYIGTQEITFPEIIPKSKFNVTHNYHVHTDIATTKRYMVTN